MYKDKRNFFAKLAIVIEFIFIRARIFTFEVAKKTVILAAALGCRSVNFFYEAKSGGTLRKK